MVLNILNLCLDFDTSICYYHNMNSKEFQTKCEKIAEDTGVDVIFCNEEKIRTDAFEDDGNLHVQQGGKLRACFDVSNGQCLSGHKQNENTQIIMEALGLTVSDRTLVDNYDEDDEE